MARTGRCWAVLIMAVYIAGGATTQTQTTVSREIAPAGTLRVGMNAANATLVTRTADGNVTGLSVDLGTFIAAKLGASFKPVVYASPDVHTKLRPR